VFHLQDRVQVALAHQPDVESAMHSVILYFGPLGGSRKPLASRNRKKKPGTLDKDFGQPHTEIKMQLSVNTVKPEALSATLVDLRRGDAAILDRIDLPGDDARRLMELGFLPGTRVTAGLSAPGGDPRVFQVDGSEIALRRETARRLKVRLEKKKTPRA
jgi:Fe2+ transport system protein FeoA